MATWPECSKPHSLITGSSGLVEAVTMLRTELDGLTMHAELLKSLAWGHQVSGITRALRCLMADVHCALESEPSTTYNEKRIRA